MTDLTYPGAPPVSRWATVAEAATYAKCSYGTMLRWIAQRRVPAERVGPRRIQVDLNEIDKLRRPIGQEAKTA